MGTWTSGRTCTPTPSCPEAPPCTPVSLTVCRRRSLPWLPPPSRSRSSLPPRGSTPSGSVAPSSPPSPPSSRCGSQAGVRRVRPLHRPPQVLLIAHSPCRLLPRGEENNILDQIAAIFIYLSVGLFPVFYSTIFPSFGHSAVYNIPSSTLIFTFFLQDISLRDFCTFINCLLELS